MSSRIYIAEDPPLRVAVDVCHGLFLNTPVKIAFAGKAGAGKTTLARTLSTEQWPVFNHADSLKEEIVEWLDEAIRREYRPYSDDCFYHFANFMGLSPARIQEDLWDLVRPVYEALIRLYDRSRAHSDFERIPSHSFELRMQFVDRHKHIFRESLQIYGSMVKEIAADPYYWVNRTIERSSQHRICFNGDTRHREEMECLRACGWIGVYLWVDEDTQRRRRPDMTDAERQHASEWGITPEDCDMVVDSTESPSVALMELAEYLSAGPIRHRVELYADSTGN